METYAFAFETPLCVLTAVETCGALTALRFGGTVTGEAAPTPLLLETQKQLLEYFAGERRKFTVPLAPDGTPFQRTVWEALLTIPYGETGSYGEIAKRIGNEKAARAVGMANNRNPIPIIIPCHRVVGASGALTGYAGGILLKEKLLLLEKTGMKM